jgi:hypothetical protein
MSYPNHITVISPMFGVVQGPVRGGHSQRLVYLHAYGLLIVTANEQGRLSFRELVEIDLTHWKPLPLLERLGAAIDPSTALAGFHLDDVIGSLIRVPRDSEEEERGKRPLMQILLALGQEPIDARWLDPEGGLGTLREVDEFYELGAKWDEPGTSCNPAHLRRQLAARAEAMWIGIVNEEMDEGSSADAMNQFMEWKKGETNDLTTMTTD